MARILILVVCASFLSFGKLSIIFYYRAQVLASIQFSNIGTEKFASTAWVSFGSSHHPYTQYMYK